MTVVWPPVRRGSLPDMFVWTKRSGRPGKTRVYWWPLVVSLLVSVVLTLLLNAAIH